MEQKKTAVQIITPFSYEDGPKIVSHLKRIGCMVLNLEDMNEDEKQRLLDYMEGVTFALEIDCQQVSTSAYVYAANGVIQSDRESVEIERSIMN